MAVDLLMVWDLSSLNVSYFVEKPTIHCMTPSGAFVFPCC